MAVPAVSLGFPEPRRELLYHPVEDHGLCRVAMGNGRSSRGETLRGERSYRSLKQPYQERGRASAFRTEFMEAKKASLRHREFIHRYVDLSPTFEKSRPTTYLGWPMTHSTIFRSLRELRHRQDTNAPNGSLAKAILRKRRFDRIANLPYARRISRDAHFRRCGFSLQR